MTFEARPLFNLTRCIALWKSDIPMKIRHYDCESINYCWVKIVVPLHLHTNLHFEDQVKIAKLMSHSMYPDNIYCS